MEGESKAVMSGELSRRSFLKVGALSASALTLAGVTNQSAAFAADGEAAEVDPEVAGTWITADCALNCGGGCVNKILMLDGVPIRQKTDDTHEDSFDFMQQRSCLRGHAQQQYCFGADRLKYPMKRKNWEPLTGGKKELRGIDEWERISWDEALEYVAAELLNIQEKYGTRSVLVVGFGPKHTYNLLTHLGGYTKANDSASFGSFCYEMARIGVPTMGLGMSVDRFTMMKSDYIVLYGCNPVWASAGNPGYIMHTAMERGCQFVFVGPEYNVTAALCNAKWIRVRPGTDTAFLLSVLYVMINEDDPENNPVIDWDFLHNNCVGFDAESMPEDAVLDENLKDYVLGAYDGIPKTPEWASEICGTPVEDIEWYGKLMGKQNKVALLHSFAAARCNGAESFPQLFYTIGAVGGHMGVEGHACGDCYHVWCGDGGTALVSPGGVGIPTTYLSNPITDCFQAPEAWQAVVDGYYYYTGDSMQGGGAPAPQEKRDIDIHMIYHGYGASAASYPDVNTMIKAHRKVDFVLTYGSFYTTNAQYADIVLPVSSPWERWTPGHYTSSSNRNAIIVPSKVCDEMYESRSDEWIIREIASRVGLNPDDVMPLDEKQMLFNYVSKATLLSEDGTRVPLVTVTQEDIEKWGATAAEPQEGVISFDELLERGSYQVPRSEGDGKSYIGWKAFRDDPVAAPLATASGKFEIYCQSYADACNAQGRSIIKPYPAYFPPYQGYEESFSDWENKVKGEYPFQLFNPHYLRRAHTTFDNLPWLREAMPNPVYLNASDAAEKGIEQGDTVIIYNSFGKVLRHASLTERLMPGVVGLPHGTWSDFDENGIDKAGADNVLNAGKASGFGVSGYNTTLVNFEKYDGEPIPNDCDLPQRIIDLD